VTPGTPATHNLVHKPPRYPVLSGKHSESRTMGFYIFYVVAIIILILHFTGWLKRNNLEWIVLVLAVATFPAVIFLK
jgi:hypothetical protein